MDQPRRVVVIGAGAWGLPAAAELARRGHLTTLVDQVGPFHALGSSHGSTRIWRLTHQDRRRVRLGRRAVQAWQRLAARAGHEVILTRGLLWRWRELDDIVAALTAEDVPFDWIDPQDVGRVFPGLRPNGVPGIWQVDAGPVLASVALGAQLRLFLADGGVLREGSTVTAVEPHDGGVTVHLANGEVIEADVAVIAAGPWAGALLAGLGMHVPLRPVVQQVTYVGGAKDESLPCLIDGPGEDPDDPSMYAMATPGRGYKLGIDVEVRELDPTRADLDPDRAVSRELEAMACARIARDLPGVDPTPRGSDVCTWTFGPGGEFVIDRAADGRVVYACGDSGEGFKFSALMGEVLADLAEGHEPDADIGAFALGRFGGDPPPAPHALLLGGPVRSEP